MGSRVSGAWWRTCAGRSARGGEWWVEEKSERRGRVAERRIEGRMKGRMEGRMERRVELTLPVRG